MVTPTKDSVLATQRLVTPISSILERWIGIVTPYTADVGVALPYFPVFYKHHSHGGFLPRSLGHWQCGHTITVSFWVVTALSGCILEWPRLATYRGDYIIYWLCEHCAVDSHTTNAVWGLQYLQGLYCPKALTSIQLPVGSEKDTSWTSPLPCCFHTPASNLAKLYLLLGNCVMRN